jgi:glycosyltransferase involved in cell wall biosynthesis
MARQLSNTGVDPRKIAVIPNWPDFELLGLSPANDIPGASAGIRDRFRNVNGSDRRRKRRKDVNDAVARPFQDLFRDGDHPKFRILYSGTLGRAHPLGTILDAAEILNRQNPDIEFVFVGDGPGQEKLAAERSRRGLENIRLLPWQPPSRLKELMESGDVHLISMNHDAAGLIVPSKLYSALAVQRPCIFIGPMNSETAKVINDFSAGVVIAQGEADALVRAIQSFRHNSDTWFAAHNGAAQAGRIFVPRESIAAWIKRARDTVGLASITEKAS